MMTIQLTIDERLLKLVDKLSQARKTTRSSCIDPHARLRNRRPELDCRRAHYVADAQKLRTAKIRTRELCLGCAWQERGARIEGDRRAATELPIVSHDEALRETTLAVLPVEKCLLNRRLVLECQFPRF
jgi:hypothetical protein